MIRTAHSRALTPPFHAILRRRRPPAGRYNRGQHWLAYARELDAERDIIVLSAGPHVHGTPQMARVLARVAQEHAAHVPRLRLVWRSQYPGGAWL